MNAAAILTVALLAITSPAQASLMWQWSMTGAGVTASGTFTTVDTPDVHGFYRITAIMGTANGGTITALQATGTAIPGNSGYAVDNLVSPTDPRLTAHGFGFAVSNGEHHNTFHNDAYRDYVSTPPYADGAGKEPSVRFTATLAPRRMP